MNAEFKKNYKKLKELSYRSTYLARDSYFIQSEIPNVANLHLDLSMGEKHIKENIHSIARMIKHVFDNIDPITSTSLEVHRLVEVIVSNKDLNNILSTVLHLDTRTIHTEMSKEELIRAVIYFFNQDNNNPEPARLYFAPLQTSVEDIVDAFELGEESYDQLWEELIDMKYAPGDMYRSLVGVVFELLRKKKMKAIWKRREEIRL